MAMRNIRKCLVLLISVLLVPTSVTATPFPVPGRPLRSQHKQMRVNNASNAQAQGQLFTATANADATTSFTVSNIIDRSSTCSARFH